MKKTGKNGVLVFLLAVMVVLTMMPAGAFAARKSLPDAAAAAGTSAEETEGGAAMDEAGSSEAADPGSDVDEETAPSVLAEPAADEEDFQMTLPTVYLHIDGGQEEVDAMNASEDHSYHCKGTMDIIVPEGFCYVDSDAVLSSVEGLPMDIRGRGNSTWTARKRPYKIKLDKKTSILGMGKNKHWALIANPFDPSLLRNRITFWLGKELGLSYTPSGYPVDVFMEGEYYGSYLLCETIRVDDNRVEIDELTDEDVEAPAITGGYFLQFAQDYNTEAVFNTRKDVQLQNVEPNFDPAEGEDETGNEAQKAYIRGYIQEAEDALHEGETPDENEPSGYRTLDYRDYIDLDTAAMYWLFQEFSANGDAYKTGSSYMYKTRDTEETPGKIFWGPLWDFDFAWGFMGGDGELLEEDFATETEWMTAMLADRSEGGLPDRIKEKWPEFKAALLALTEDGGMLDQYYEEVRISQSYDQEKYGWVDDYDNPLDYKEAVEALRSWILGRIDWMDAHLSLLDDYSHKISFKQDENDEHPSVYYQRTGEKVSGDLEPLPEKEGYFCVGWYTEDGVHLGDVTVEQDVTFLPKFVDEESASKADHIYFRYEDMYVQLSEGGQFIYYSVTPPDALDQRIRWESADEQIATVNEDGILVPHAQGTTTITAHLPTGATGSFRVHVGEGTGEFRTASIVRTPLYMRPGDIRQMKVVIDPYSAPTFMDFESEDPSVARIDSNGVVTALSPGRTSVHINVYYDFDKEEWENHELYGEIIVSDREGVLTTETKTTGISGEAPGLKEAAEAILTDEDRADLAGGADINLCLDMKLLEDSAVPAGDKDLLDAYLKKEGLTGGAFLDIRLIKTVGEQAEEVHKTDVPIRFSVGVPASLKSAGADVTRTFKLLRVHDGQVAEVGSSAGDAVTGESDQFSTYMLAYADEQSPEDEPGGTDGKDSGTADKDSTPGGQSGSASGDGSASAGKGGTHTDAPGTGDDSQTGRILALSGISLAVLIWLLIVNRKKRR